MKTSSKSLLFILMGAVLFGCGQTTQQQHISPEELSAWQTFDKGKTSINGDELIVEEIEGSDGYFMISPNLFDKDFVLQYKVKALSKSTVLINLFSANQSNETFTLPPDTATPQEVWQWRTEMSHYNLTFNNRSHGITPFFFKNNSPRSRGFHQSLQENVMEVGKWYSVEIGKKENRLWFKLNDTIYFDIEDCDPLGGGRLIFRISGTTGETVIFAKAAYKEIVINYE